MRPRLKIPPQRLREYVARYNPEADPPLEHISAAARRHGYLTAKQLHAIAYWKSRRRADLTLKNPNSFVREITSFAFSAKHEESRIGSLVLLRGVEYPTASVILHFCVSEDYPILDFRALETLGIEKPHAYSASFWLQYMQICRGLAAKHDLTVRQLDMALWQFSKERAGDA